MKANLLCITIATTFFSLAAQADDLNNLGALSQAKFQTLSEDLTAALSYKAVAPAEPLGLTGFDIGIEVTGTSLEKCRYLEGCHRQQSIYVAISQTARTQRPAVWN